MLCLRAASTLLLPCVIGLAACESEVLPAELHARAAAHEPAATPATKNVVLVTIDTLRADFVGAYGGPAQTRNLDHLAKEAWLFERCFSASMLTNPAHASIMTSLYPRDHGVYDNESGIHDGLRTLATTLQRYGAYTAAVVGFPHLNPKVSNLGQGFTRVIEAEARERNAAQTTSLALQLLDARSQNEPFFVWVHYTDPHAPYELPENFSEPTVFAKATPMRRAAAAAPAFQRKNPWFKRAFQRITHVETLTNRYLAEIEATDDALGALLDGLVERGLKDSTLVVVTSDHGESFGERELYFHHGGLYATTTHVPLIIRIPGAQPARFAGLVESVDIAPTVLEALGLPRWEPMRGRSLVGQVQGRELPRQYVFSEHMQRQLVAARSRKGLLVVHRVDSRQFPTYRFESGRLEYYDLVRDPAETQPADPSQPEAVRLQRALSNYLGAGLQYAARAPVQQDRDSLRALGYLE